MSIVQYFEDIPPIGHSQRSLLLALVSDAPTDRQCFKDWVESVNFEALDYSSLRLVPALFSKFSTDPVCAPYRGRMLGIYRYFYFRSTLLAADAYKAVQALVAAGIEPLLFKGMAIALKFHQSPALRPMGDVDVLVHPAQAARAQEVLAKLGWRYRYTQAQKSRDIHSHDYINANKNGFDLHWYTLPESASPDADQAVWQHAEHTQWQGTPVRIMGREHLVLIAMVNGLRERDAMRYEWLYDVALIVRSQPGFDWQLVWAESGTRQLRNIVFDALLMVNHVMPDMVSAQQLHAWFESDLTLCQGRLMRLVSETRTHSLDQSQRASIEALLATPAKRRLHWLRPSRSRYQSWSQDTSHPKHIRYSTTLAGHIDALYLHFHHLPLLRTLFKVADAAALKALTHPFPAHGEGVVSVPPGLLSLPSHTQFPLYHARIQMAAAVDTFVLPASESGEVPLVVTNDSAAPWQVFADRPALYGLSYHLLSENGDLLQWDQPRTYFMQARANHMAFVMPGQSLPCRMKVHAPAQPGSYVLQLDVLQETVLWFSSQGMRFPDIRLTVTD